MGRLIQGLLILCCIFSDTQGLESYSSAHRYYDTQISRFISADPVNPDPENSQGLNRYAYVYNSPVRLIDSTGNTPNLPIGSSASPFSLALPDAGSLQEDDLLNMRLDFDASGAVINNSKNQIFLNEEGDSISGSRVAYTAAFATREALRFKFSDVDLFGRATDLLMEPVNTNESKEVYRIVSQRSRRIHLDGIANRSNLHSVRDQGFNAGMSQTPVLISISEPNSRASRALRFNFYLGSLIPSALSVGGGAFGIAGALQSDNDFVRGLGVAGGSLDLAGGLWYARNAHVISTFSSATVAARTSASFSMLSALHLMRLGGVTMFVSFAAEGVIRLDQAGAFDREREITPEAKGQIQDALRSTDKEALPPFTKGGIL